MFLVLIVLAIVNTYKWIVCGEQNIKISTSSKAYTSSELYLSVIAQENGVDLETKTKIKLLYISNGNTENVTITFDKGIYKPGDTVNFRALLTDREKDEPVEKETNICIYDGNDNKVYNEKVKSSDYGIVSGSFTLTNEVNSGIYKLVVKTDTNETTKQFKVNPYITPKYEIKIDFDKQNYLVGDTAIIKINSNYFFGEAVSNAKYTIYINDKEYQNVTADANGNATINYEIKEAKTYTIKVEAVDSSNYFIEESNNFVAGTDLFEVELLSEYGSLVAGEKNDIYVFTKNADGTPIKTYITISSDYYTKQVATDENGIAKFSIDIDSIKSTSSFGTTDENNNSVEAALLVRMALSDLNFSNEIDGATLYSCIIDDTSEQTMMALLLKQSGKDVKISETTLINYEEEEKSVMIAIISIALIIIFAYLCKKFDKFRNVMKHVLTCIIFNLIVIILSMCIIDEFFWRTIDYSWWTLGITVAVCSAILIEIFEIPAQIFLVVVAAIILILAIISKIDEVKKNGVIGKILKESVYICKFIGALVLSIVIGNIIQKITDIDGIIISISIIGVYFFNYFFNKIGKEQQNKEVKLPNKEDIITYIVIVLAIVGLLTIGYLIKGE